MKDFAASASAGTGVAAVGSKPNQRAESDRSFHEDAERVGAIVGKGRPTFEASSFIESQCSVTGYSRLQAKNFDACMTCLRHQSIQNFASYSLASRRLFNPHSLNFRPVPVENKSASCQGFPLPVAGHEKTHLGPSEDIQRKMVITFRRIEAGGECLPMTHKLNDLRLSWVFPFDD
jgi:hypothetical protein